MIKHFVANDAETERMTVNSVVDERTLRELYLLPFEIGFAQGGALGLMTAYNRLNGIWCSEHAELLSLPEMNGGLMECHDRLVRGRFDRTILGSRSRYRDAGSRAGLRPGSGSGGPGGARAGRD